jgi:hypothetical protein
VQFVVCFICRVQSLPRCLQLATFPVSMMVMVSTSGPHVQRKMVGTAYLSGSLMVWPGHCHSPESCVIIIHLFDVESLSSHMFHSWTCFMIHILEWQLYSSAWCDGWRGLSLCRINILEEYWNCCMLMWRIYCIMQVSTSYIGWSWTTHNKHVYRNFLTSYKE